jgi:phosphorylase kinase alpha/beta subunit
MTTPLTTADAFSRLGSLAMLEKLDGQVQRVLLQRQHPISGLIPASTAHTVHGNYGDTWVRDGV